MDCELLQDVVLHEGLKSIESDAFFRTDVTSVELPNSMQEIAEDAFNVKCNVANKGKVRCNRTTREFKCI